MKYSKILVSNNTFKHFHPIWEESGSKLFSCIWNTDVFDFSGKELRNIVALGCVAFISIGKNADKLHDAVDSIVEAINIDNDPDFDIDTRGGIVTNYTLTDAIFELEHNLFEEDQESFGCIYIFDRKQNWQ